MKARAPADAKLEFTLLGASPGIEIDTKNSFVEAAGAALADEYGTPAVMIGCGGSIPVVENFHRILGIDTLLMGFGLEDDQPHSPNEKFEVECFRHGLRSHVRLLGALAIR